jgi:hypothetical protein
MKTTCEEAGLTTDLVPAPEGAVTFDQMFIVFSGDSKKMIRNVYMIDSKMDRVVGIF